MNARTFAVVESKNGVDTFKVQGFVRKEREYTVDRMKHIREPQELAKPFVPKEEYTKPKFDPNIRQRPMEMPNHLMYRFMYGIVPQKEPQSAYVSVYHKGQTWHLFNAERINLGRMAAMAAVFIRGKHKPGYAQNKFDMGDKIVVVNASKVKVSGKKRYQKLYRHHTGYPGGLKEILMKDLIEKNPCEIIRRAIEGMLPNNTIRDILIERNLIVHEGQYHNHIAQKLPQFVDTPPVDINEQLGLKSINPDNSKVIFESSTEAKPEEFDQYERDIDEKMGIPMHLQEKEKAYNRKNFKLGRIMRQSFHKLKRYREYK